MRRCPLRPFCSLCGLAPILRPAADEQLQCLFVLLERLSNAAHVRHLHVTLGFCVCGGCFCVCGGCVCGGCVCGGCVCVCGGFCVCIGCFCPIAYTCTTTCACACCCFHHCTCLCARLFICLRLSFGASTRFSLRLRLRLVRCRPCIVRCRRARLRQPFFGCFGIQRLRHGVKTDRQPTPEATSQYNIPLPSAPPYRIPQSKEALALWARVRLDDAQTLLRTNQGHELAKVELWVGQRRRAADKLQPSVAVVGADAQQPE